MTSMNYDWNFWWVKSGLDKCGLDAAPTYDMVMVNTFDSEPDWTQYAPETAKTLRAMMLF